MRQPFGILSLALLACLVGAPPTLAQAPGDLRQQARELIELAQRGRTSLLALEATNARLRERIAVLEGELARAPADDGRMTRDEARADIADLRERVRLLEAEIRARGPSLAEVRPQAEATQREVLARFSAVEPDRSFVAARLGEPVRPEPPGVSCALQTATAAALVICRTPALAELDSRLNEAFRAAQRGKSAIDQRFGEQEQRMFYARLESCVDGFGALLSDDALARARDCLSSRYPVRIAAITPGGGAVDPPRNQRPNDPPAAQVVYVTTRANLRAQPSTNSAIVDSREACAELQVLGRASGGEWVRVATAPRQTAYIASFLVTDRRPDECGRSVRGTVTAVLDPGRIVVASREIRLWGIEPSRDERSRRGMAEILSLYDNQVSCSPRADRFVCSTQQRSNLASLDLAIIAIFNGGACPASGLHVVSPIDDAAYRAARRDAERQGVSLRCP